MNKEYESWKPREKYYHDQVCRSIDYIRWYCYLNESCNKCTIKDWCKNKKKKCPEEWNK